MQTTSHIESSSLTRTFPLFSLSRLLRTVFEPAAGEKVCILIDLPRPEEVGGFRFLQDPALSIQRNAHRYFYEGLHQGVLGELDLRGGEMFAYAITGGSNLDLPDRAIDRQGRTVSLRDDIYCHYNIILCISTFSATAPLTAFAKEHGFRGATLHGLNEIILNSGLAVDYNAVSRDAEKLRLGMTGAAFVEIDFGFEGEIHTLRLELSGQEAQKSHGLCRASHEVANLPAGEIYYVPTGAKGRFPMRYEDGTIGLMEVSGGRIGTVSLLDGSESTIEAHRQKLQLDPLTGELGELGFGTQELPVSGRDIQDEKILGTLHVATGRSDHLGGSLTPDRFVDSRNATHDDILFSPGKTPGIDVVQARMVRRGATRILIEHYQPVYMRELLEA